MPLGERATRSRLQVLRERHGVALARELHRDDQRPRTTVPCVTGWPVIVPIEPRLEIVGYSNVMTRGVAVATKHVDESLFDVVHAPRDARNAPASRSNKSQD